MSKHIACILLLLCGWPIWSVCAQERTLVPTTSEIKPNVGIPPFHLTRVELEGEILGDRASLRATVDITVNHGDNWHNVPLRLGQAHVWRRSYQGMGEEAPDSTLGAEEGLVWKVRGIGRHQLTFDLWVPIKRIPGGGQLQLSLPALPPQFETSLKLQIPQAPVSIRIPKETTTILSHQDQDGTTAIQASVAGGRLDISWHPAVAPRGSLAQVRSNWTVMSELDHLSVIVDQVLQFEPEQLSEIRVKAPPQLAVVEVSGLFVESWRPDPGRPGWLLVQLNPGTSDKAELRWLLERNSLTAAETLQLEGLDVEGSSRQTGQVRVEPQPETRVVADLNRSRFVQRVESSAPRNPTDLDLTAVTYEYTRQPFRLQLLSAPITTVTTIEPSYELDFQETEVRLTATFKINVEAGNIRQFEIISPEAAAHWEDIEITENGRVLALATAELEDVAKVTWDVPRTGQVVLQVTARQPVVKTTPWSLRLPVPQASHMLPANVRLTTADPLELHLGREGEPSPLVALATAPPENAGPPENLGNSTAGAWYRLVDANSLIPLSVEVHPRELSARSLVEIVGAEERAIQVKQQLTLNVRYGRIASIGLLVPEELSSKNPAFALNETVQVFFRGNRLVPVAPDGLRVALPTPLSGEIPLEIRYRYPLPAASASAASEISVPIVAIEEVELADLQCQVTQLDQIQVRESSDWGAVTTSLSGALWVAKNPVVRSIPVIVSSELAQASQQYVVERANLWTRFSANGVSETCAAYELADPPARIVLQLPAGVSRESLLGVTLNGKSLTDSQLELIPGDKPELRISLDDSASGPVVLELRYRQATGQAFGLTHAPLIQFPAFPRSVWISETNWELLLPAGHHLFVYPAAFTPRFHWQRRGLFWQRVATADYLQDRQTLWADAATKLPAELGYAFRAFGPVADVQLRSMSQSLILLVGAGTTLLLGFMFWKLHFTRNLLTLVTLAFAVSVASMWYLESIQLLLQPALIGLGLAGLATFLDSRFRKPVPLPVRPRSNGSSIVSPPAGPVLIPPVGTESATKVPSTIYRPNT